MFTRYLRRTFSQPDLSGFPEGHVGQPFYGWLRAAHHAAARFNGLIIRALAIAEMMRLKPYRVSTLKRAKVNGFPLTSPKRAGLFALRESGLKAAGQLREASSLRVFVAAVLLCLLGCSGVSQSSSAGNNQPSGNANDSAMNENQNKQSGGNVDERLAAANTRFGFKLFREVVGHDEGKNIFISPASVALCLAMAYNGAEAETKQAMARALEIQAISLDELNRAYAELKSALENPDPKVQLQIANSLWARRGLTFKPDFIQRNKQFFGAEVTELNFDDAGAPATINRWVSDKTKGKITKIVDQISPDSILFLINAIYFKGAWAKEFDKAKTKEDVFTPASGAQKRLPMMHQSGNYNYYEGSDFQAVSLPYGGGRASMYIFLPSKNSGLSAFQKSLSESNWESWMKAFRETEGDVSLPRFKVEYEVTLNDMLKALGMGVAFDEGRANFRGMIEGTGNVFISQVKHKTFAEVNEEGTEAAAVTSTEMRTTSVMRPRQRFSMVVDRPFFCAIRDNTTGTVLFMGAITDPQ